MNKFIEATAIAISSILAHKLRSFLTLLGVIIGVAVVTAVATVIEGANVYIKEKIATLGSGVFTACRRPASPGLAIFRNSSMRSGEIQTSRSMTSSHFESRVTLADQIGAQDGGSKPVSTGTSPLRALVFKGSRRMVCCFQASK